MDQISLQSKLDEINKLEDGSSNLDIEAFLDHLDYNDREAVLELVMRKIQLNGTLKFNGTDISSLFHEFIYGPNNTQSTNEHIYKLRSMETSKRISEILLAKGFSIEEKRINHGPLHCEYFITARRKG